MCNLHDNHYAWHDPPSFAYVSLRVAPPPRKRKSAPRCSRYSRRDRSRDGPGPPTGVPAMLRELQAGGQVLRIRIVLVVVARDSRPRAKQPAPRLEARRPLLLVPGQHDFAQVFHRPKLLVVSGRPRLVKDSADQLVQARLGLVLEPSVPPAEPRPLSPAHASPQPPPSPLRLAAPRPLFAIAPTCALQC